MTSSQGTSLSYMSSRKFCHPPCGRGWNSPEYRTPKRCGKCVPKAVPPAKPLTFTTVRMEGVFRSEIHKESRSGLRKPERIVLRRDDIRIHRRFYPMLECRPASQLFFPATKDVEHVLLAVDIPKPIRRASSVQHPMSGLYACPNCKRAFKDSLCSLVFVIPRLELVTKEELDALDVHLPGRV